MSTATRVDVPDSAVADFAHDYVDCFRVASVPGGRTAADWARATLRGADGAFGRVVWRGILGFELASPGTPDTLVGWSIRQDGRERFVLEGDGSLMAGRMVFDVDDDEVRWTTSLHFHRSIGAAIWAGAGVAHRWLAPRTLDGGRRRLLR
jgi:hypothetical protein